MQAVDSNATGGRRRVAQLTTEQWREALQQQMQEKEQEQQRKKNARHYQPADTMVAGSGSDDGGGNNQAPEKDVSISENSLADGVSQQKGRRAVRVLSTDEWKASLDDQMREREQQQQKVKLERRGQTAPHSQSKSDCDVPPTTGDCAAPSPMRPIATAPVDPATTSVTGARRRHHQGGAQQTREEYLKALQEQIELKKQRDQEADTESTRRSGVRCRKRLVDECGNNDPVVDATATATIPVPVPPIDAPPVQMLAGQDTLPVLPPEQTQPSPCKDAVAISTLEVPVSSEKVVAMDAIALSKLFELCEGMKQQNDELQQQLRDQQSVLVSLAAQQALKKTPPPAKAVGSNTTTKQTKQTDKRQPRDGRKQQKEDLPSKQHATKTTQKPILPAVQKLPVKKSPVASALTSNNARERDDSTAHDVDQLKSNGGGGGSAARPQKPAVAESVSAPSRLLQPRIVPQMRAKKAPAATKNQEVVCPAPINDPPNNDPLLPMMEKKPISCDPSSQLGKDGDTLSLDETKHDDPAVPEVCRRDVTDDHKLPPLALARTDPLPHKVVRPNTPQASTTSLPSIKLKSSSCHQPLELAPTCFPFEDDLEAMSSSVAILDGPSAMVSCTSHLFHLF